MGCTWLVGHWGFITRCSQSFDQISPQGGAVVWSRKRCPDLGDLIHKICCLKKKSHTTDSAERKYSLLRKK